MNYLLRSVTGQTGGQHLLASIWHLMQPQAGDGCTWSGSLGTASQKAYWAVPRGQFLPLALG